MVNSAGLGGPFFLYLWGPPPRLYTCWVRFGGKCLTIIGIFFGHFLWTSYWITFRGILETFLGKHGVRRRTPFLKRLRGLPEPSWKPSWLPQGSLGSPVFKNAVKEHRKRMFSKTLVFAILALLDRFQRPHFGLFWTPKSGQHLIKTCPKS